MSRLTSMLLFALAIFATDCFADDEATLRHFKTVLWPTAYRTQDVELLDRLLHDSFELIKVDGTRSSKRDELEYIKNNKWNPAEFQYRIDRLDIYSDSFAIVSGAGIAATYRYKSSNVLIKEEGRWRAVASHVSGFESLDDE